MKQQTITPASAFGSSRMPRLGKYSMLCAPEPDGGGGGAGGGAPGGGAPFSQDQINAINGAVKAHIQRIDFSAMVAPIVTASLKSALDTALPDIIKQVGGEVAKASAAPADKKAAAGAIPDEVKNQIAKLEAELGEQRKAKEAETAKALKAEQSERNNTLTSRFSGALKDVRTELSAGALAVVRDKAGEIVWTDGPDGKKVPMVKVDRNVAGVGPYSEQITPEAFVAEWQKTDEGKGYMPAPKGSGSGTGAGGRPNPGGGQGQGGGQPPNGARPKGVSDHDLGSMMLAAYTQGSADE